MSAKDSTPTGTPISEDELAELSATDIQDALHAATKLGAFMESFNRAKSVLEIAARAAQRQHVWSDDQRAALLAHHTAHAEAEAQKIIEAAEERGRTIERLAETQSASTKRAATQQAQEQLEQLSAQVSAKERERGNLQTEIDAGTAQLQVLEQRVAAARAGLRAAG